MQIFGKEVKTKQKIPQDKSRKDSDTVAGNCTGESALAVTPATYLKSR